jgi:hypothetical protein
LCITNDWRLTYDFRPLRDVLRLAAHHVGTVAGLARLPDDLLVARDAGY